MNRILRISGRLGLALLQMTAGIGLGLVLLELILRLNPPLMAGLRGLGAPLPMDVPLTATTYDVYDSGGDQLYWRPDLVRPIPPEEDRLESRVTLTTDEFGFRNPAPLPASTDVIVLGRSFSLGAQVPSPWPDQLAAKTGWKVVNLSEPGSSPEVKLDYLSKYGLPRNPRWVVIEVEPPIDALHYEPSSHWIIQLLPIPLIQEIYRQAVPTAFSASTDFIYPLEMDLPGRTLKLTCCIHYLDALTLTSAEWQASRNWIEFTAALTRIVNTARRNSICTAILYAPTKPEIYFPLALDPRQLLPALREVVPLRLDEKGRLTAEPGTMPDLPAMQANAMAARDALAAYADANRLIFIDPSDRMTDSVLAGRDPFLPYDSHWNELGQTLVAQSAADALEPGNCP